MGGEPPDTLECASLGRIGVREPQGEGGGNRNGLVPVPGVRVVLLGDAIAKLLSVRKLLGVGWSLLFRFGV